MIAALPTAVLLLAAPPSGAAPAVAERVLRFETAPIYYTSAPADNALTRLADEVDSGRRRLPHDPALGALPAVLAALDVPVESQALAFAKLSLQKDRIGPASPRAVYFSDDAYVGYVPGGELEAAVTDRNLGLSFHTLTPLPPAAEGEPPGLLIDRETTSCLTCHAGSRTRGVPGLLVRSVFPGPAGHPVLPLADTRTHHGSPLSERFGGWYVTGSTGPGPHRGNFTLPSRGRPTGPVDNAAGRNVRSLAGRFDASRYPSPHSDVVALMTLEHQVDAHNLMVRAGYAHRLDRQAGNHESPDAPWRDEAEALLAHLLFEGEWALEHPVEGVGGFREAFEARGPFDGRGRSLRRFDLRTRLFRYPLSYTVHSDGFAHLPDPVRALLYRRLQDVTAAGSEKFPHLTPADRAALREILPAVLPELAIAWTDGG